MSLVPPSPRPSPRGLTVSHIFFAGHRGFRPLLEKTDANQSIEDLLHQILGATIAMLQILILGNQPSEATTDGPARQSRNQRSWATDGTPIKHGKRKRSASLGTSLLGIRVPSVFHPWLP